MKNLSLILNAILLLAVGVLFFLFLSKKADDVQAPVNSKNTSGTASLPIAYVNIDSLLLNYTFAKSANEALISKQESSRATLNSKASQLQTEFEEFNRKLNNQAFLSQDRAEQEHSRILQKQNDLRQLEGNLSNQLMEQQQKLSEQLRDTVNNFLKQYNKAGKYELIISNTANDNILYSKKGYDITSEVIKLLNERYAKAKKK